MHLRQRLLSAAVVAVAAAAVLYGSTLEVDGSAADNGALSWSGSKETIYFWYSDENLTNFLNSAAVSFGEREDVRVIPVLTSDSEYLETLNQATLYSSQMPDAYIVSHDALEKAYLAGLAVPIPDSEGICNGDNFPPAALSAVTCRGKLVGYPLYFETSALIYNETYLAEWASQIAMQELLNAGEGEEGPENEDGIPVDEEKLAALTREYFAHAVPATVDDILNVAITFDVPLGVEGVMKWDVSHIFYNYWIAGNYMTVGGDSGDDPSLININNPETIQCLEVYKALNQFFFIEPNTVDYDSVLEDFCEGKFVFTIATTDAARRLAEAKAEGRLSFEYGAAPLPWVSEELKSRTMSVTNVVAVNGYSQHGELANRFAAYLVGECAEFLYERTGKAAANLNVDGEDSVLQVFKAEYSDSVPLPKLMEAGNFWMQLEGLFSKVWNGADVTELVQELADSIAMQVKAAEQ